MTFSLERRLAKGPLRVRSLFTPRPSSEVARRLLRRRRLYAWADVLVMAACIAIAFVAYRRDARVAVPAPDPNAAFAAPRSIAFADGSTAELSDRETDLRVEHDGVERVVTSLKGAARFVVVPNASRPFEVRTADLRVRVIGTRFAVRELGAGQTLVSVEHGRVQVEWLGGNRVLGAGEQGVFPPATSAVADLAPATSQPFEPEAKASPEAPIAPKPRSESAAQGWRDYALKGEYQKAYVEMKGKALVRDEPADLMLAADVARLSAHPSDAVAPLRKLYVTYPSDKRAPVAAFTLGRVLLDDLGRAQEAAAVFEKARLLWPSGPLAEDALAREVEAWTRAGNTELARSLADRYLERYPAGRHAAALRKMRSR